MAYNNATHPVAVERRRIPWVYHNDGISLNYDQFDLPFLELVSAGCGGRSEVGVVVLSVQCAGAL